MLFAKTKIRPPRPRLAALITRPALERRLGDALLNCRLVLVCAAGGFGKTSALASQAETLPPGTAFAWVSCDEDDRLATLIECLAGALEPFDLPWRTEPEALARSLGDRPGAGVLRAAAAELINALDACDVPHGVIVLDDLHRIDDPAVPAFIDLLLERLAPLWTIALASRTAPPLATARLRAHGDLAEFGPDDLRFAPVESLALAARAGITAADAQRLHERTEGWPVGLRLALAAPMQAPRALDRHVTDYLATEVIAQLEPGLRDFLLQTALLPELTAARCAAVSGDATAAERLDAIQRAGLFVTALTGAEPTLRLHDLFREALEARFQREQPQQHAQALVRAAATEPDPLRRVAWLQRAGRWDAAEEALAGSADELIAGGAAAAVRGLFERFPPAQRTTSARLQMLLARSQWDWDTAIAATERAAAAFGSDGDATARLDALSYHALALSGANRHERLRQLAAAVLADPALGGNAQARTLAALTWVEIARGDQPGIAALWARLIDRLEASDSLALWTECAPLGPFVGLPGMRPQLERFLDGALRRLPEHPTPLRGTCQVLQAWLQLWAGDPAQARLSAERAAADSRWLARPANLDAPTRSLQAVLLALRGDAAGARAMLVALIDEVRTSGVAMRVEVYLGLYHYLAMRCAAATGDLATLREMAERLAAESDAARGWLSPELRAGARAHLAALDGELDLAARRWHAMLEQAQRSDLYGQVVDTRLRLADALCRLGRPTAHAAAVLQPLFDELEASGEWGAVLLAGPALLARLAAVRWGESLGVRQRERLAAWAGQPGPPPAEPSTGPAVLTSREIEVLALITEGQSNKLIARALELSPHTVKRHVANILDKLDLVSRGQAAAWYRERSSGALFG